LPLPLGIVTTAGMRSNEASRDASAARAIDLAIPGPEALTAMLIRQVELVVSLQVCRGRFWLDACVERFEVHVVTVRPIRQAEAVTRFVGSGRGWSANSAWISISDRMTDGATAP
jgi:hypothetical protein